MTEAQRKHFYFPIWRDTAAKLDWKMESGRLLADLDVQKRSANNFPDHAATEFSNIINAAQLLAGKEQRAVTADDLRHACNRIASGGHHESSTKFSRRDLNQFDRLCAVLRDPWDMNAMIAWENPDEDDRKRTVEYLRTLANEGRLRAIALNAWGTADWETLDQARLDALQAEIKKGAWSKYPRKTGQPF